MIEKCEEGSQTWQKVPGVVSGTSHTVRDLEPGKKYKFRVKAENMYGTGEPVETDRAVLAKNPYGKSLVSSLEYCRILSFLSLFVVYCVIPNCFLLPYYDE